LLWKLAGWREVSVVTDRYALVTGTPTTDPGGSIKVGPWILIDTATGKQVGPDQQWPDTDTFRNGCCGESEYQFTRAIGGVVIANHLGEVDVWYPAPVTLVPHVVTLG
jgi:hypothetical protein